MNRGPLLATAAAVLIAVLSAARPDNASALPAPIYVDAMATGSGDGSTWENAYPDLWLALLSNPTPGTFFVAQGTYKPLVLIGEPRDYAFAVKAGQKVQGGYRGGPVDPDDHDPSLYHTILTGERGGAAKSDNHRTVLFFNLAAGETASIRDVEITGGYEERAGVSGGGIVSTAGNAEIYSSRIHDNYSRDFGGGITIQGGGVLIENSDITDNTTDLGATTVSAGLYFGTLSGSARVNGSEISHSGDGIESGGFLLEKGLGTLEVVGSAFGGAAPSDAPGPVSGVYVGGGKSSFTDVLFLHLGTALWVDDDDTVGKRTVFFGSGAAIVNSTDSGNVFFNNSSIVASDAPLFTRGTLELRNTTLIDNGGGTSPTAPKLINSISWSSEETAPPATPAIFEHSIIDTPAACGTTITCTDVSFDDPLVGPLGDWGGPNLSVPLAFDSPAVDTGFAPECAAYDQRNYPRPVDGDGDGAATCDLGAFELDPPTVTFASAVGSVREAAANHEVLLRRTGVLLTGETVTVEAVGGSALPGADYRFAALTVTVPSDLPVLGGDAVRAALVRYGAGRRDSLGPEAEHLVPVNIRILDDFLVEPGETVRLRVSNPTGTLIGTPDQHTTTITDNEPRLKCAGVAATMVGSSGADIIVGTDGRDIIVARGGNDRIRSAGGNDRVCAGPGNDTVRGGGGNDVAFGHGGEDALIGGPGRDQLRGGGANDALTGSGGNDELLGQRGTDALKGGVGRDRLSGGPGDGDRCEGGPGTDTLVSKSGCETVSGVP